MGPAPRSRFGRLAPGVGPAGLGLAGWLAFLEVLRGGWNCDGSFPAVAITRWDGKLTREQLCIILDRQLLSGALINSIRMNGIAQDSVPDDAFLRRAYQQSIRFQQHWWRGPGGQADGLLH